MLHGEPVTVEQIGNFSIVHTGVCYRNSKLATTSTEEPQSAMMVRVTTKFSEGKQLNLNHTDAYIACNKLAFCRIGEGNIEKIHDNGSARLGLGVTSPESAYLSSAAKR